ncbi:MAG: hydroxymethylglutaryl-CoA reductase (NADPH) [Aigarchaeota archaeon]|nr:hydroxymethylglutaryl-CoA reductase (NADPH) [Candidatus Pelearchaeum maunauluense]
MTVTEIDELVKRILRGEVRLHEVEKHVKDSNVATRVRRRAIEEISHLDLSPLDDNVVDFNDVVGRNCENTIGCVKVPMGIAGPLKVRGDHASGEYLIPLATTEGALVASVNRGASAITESGGAVVKVLDDKITRAPVFKTPSLEKAVEFIEWVEDNFGKIKEVFESTTRHGRLLRIRPYVVGRTVFLRFEASSGDAMGMNMIVKATDEVSRFIHENLPWVENVSLSGNLCTDKKAAAINWVLGRGKSVIAEAVVSRETVEKKLKTTPDRIVEVVLRKLYLGSGRAGVLGGFNAHVANVIAALFLATGQDLAQVVDSSHCITYCEELDDGDLYISITLPTLEVGTVGGGTSLPTQRKALEIIGVAGGGEPPGTNALKFAEIVAATVLAGELSLLSALAAHHLADAHMRLGRKK